MNIGQIMTEVGAILDKRLFDVAGTPVTVSTLLSMAVVVLAAFIGSLLLQRIIRAAFRRRGVEEQSGTVHVVLRLMHYSILALGLGVALGTAGIDLGALFAAGAVFAVGLGFAMQNIAQNFVSGLILLAERTIKPGDVLEVEGQVVKVTRLGIRATVVRTLNAEDLIVPNSILVQSTVKNFTLTDTAYRIRATVGVTYGSDMKLVLETLREVAETVSWRLDEHKPRILMQGFGNNSVDFDVSVWTGKPFLAQTQRSELNQAIWWALKERGIVIAFPQLDVHFDAPVSEGFRRIGGAAA